MQKLSGGNVNQNSSTSPSENCTEAPRRRRSSSGSSKSKTSQQSNSDTKIDKRRKRSQSEESVGSWTTSPGGSAVKGKEKSTSSGSSVKSTVGSFSKTSLGGNTVSGKSSSSSVVEKSPSSRSRKKSGTVPTGSSTLSNINLDSTSGVGSRSSKVSVSSSKTRRSSGSSLTSVSSEGLFTGNCEKCRQVKKGRKGKDTDVKVKSTRTWSVSVADLHSADSKSVIPPEKPLTSLSDTFKGKTEDSGIVQSWTSSIKLSLRPSTQAQSKAEVGTYRVSRKRSNAANSSTSVVEPVAKCSKVESRTDSDIKSEKRIEVSVVNQGIHEQALPPSFLIAGPSYSRDFPSQPPKKKSKLDKKSKKKDKKSHKLESQKGATGSSASKSSPPELNSLRRHTRTKKTGSCASSRWVLVLSEFI